jgi:hypothetical protein
MKRKYTQTYSMLTRVVNFTTQNVGLFPKNSAASKILEALDSDVTQLSEQAGAQVSAEAAIRISRKARDTARETLKSILVLAAQTAQALNSDQLRGPLKRGDQALIDCGHAFAQDVESLKKEFIQHGWAPDFGDEVSAAVEALEQATLDYASATAKRAAAIGEYVKTMEDAMGYLKRLDILVAKTLADDPTAMASWTVARSVIRTPVRKRAAKPPDLVPAPVPAAA